MTTNEKKALIEKTVRTAKNSSYEGENKSVPVSDGQTWSELKPKQLVAVQKNLETVPTEDTLVLFYDTTVFNSGKSGILFTTEGIACDHFLKGFNQKKKKGRVLCYDAIRSVRQAHADEDLSIFTDGTGYTSPSYMIIEYKDGRTESAYASIYCQFIVKCLNDILQALFDHETAPAGQDLPESETAREVEPEPKESQSIGPEPAQDEPAPEEDFSNIIILNDENGDPVYFEFLDLIPYEGEEYVVLLPVDENDEPKGEEIIILKIQPHPDDPELEEYVPVESEQILQEVFGLFRDKFRDLYDFQEPEPEQRPDEADSFLPVPYSGTEPYIFVSYSHKDSEQVMGIIRQLQADGYRVWYDEGIDPGTEWDDNIAAHVEKCGCFLAFISNNYLQSENCKDELNYARDLNLSRLLIYLEEVALTGGMAMRHNRLQAVHYYKYQQMKGMFYKRLYDSPVLINSMVK